MSNHEDSWFKIVDYHPARWSFDDVQKIIDRISDSISRDIFTNCFMFSLTNDPKYVRNNIEMTEIGNCFSERLSKISCKHPMIYGAGIRGKHLVQLFPEIEWGGYFDKNDVAQQNELSVLPVWQIGNVGQRPIVISNMIGYQEIKRDLMSEGIKESNIICFEEWNSRAANEQYFESRCFDQNIKGAFVDCGAYDGRDTIQFLREFGKEAWVFEPDKEQMIVCKKNIMDYEKITEHETIVHYEEIGASDINEDLRFTSGQGGLSRVSDDGEKIIHCRPIDEMIFGENVDFIKLDIEGFEERAIWGMQNTIKKNNPQLAISVYHKRTDIIRLPKLLLELNPNYSFTLGHYSLGQVDTVLYARL